MVSPLSFFTMRQLFPRDRFLGVNWFVLAARVNWTNLPNVAPYHRCKPAMVDLARTIPRDVRTAPGKPVLRQAAPKPANRVATSGTHPRMHCRFGWRRNRKGCPQTVYCGVLSSKYKAGRDMLWPRPRSLSAMWPSCVRFMCRIVCAICPRRISKLCPPCVRHVSALCPPCVRHVVGLASAMCLPCVRLVSARLQTLSASPLCVRFGGAQTLRHVSAVVCHVLVLVSTSPPCVYIACPLASSRGKPKFGLSKRTLCLKNCSGPMLV